jgi:hypothetical protein
MKCDRPGCITETEADLLYCSEGCFAADNDPNQITVLAANKAGGFGAGMEWQQRRPVLLSPHLDPWNATYEGVQSMARDDAELGGWKVGDTAIFNHPQTGPVKVEVIKVVLDSDAGPHLKVEDVAAELICMAEPHELSRPA